MVCYLCFTLICNTIIGLQSSVIDIHYHFEMNGLRKYSTTKERQLGIGKDYDKTKRNETKRFLS